MRFVSMLMPEQQQQQQQQHMTLSKTQSIHKRPTESVQFRFHSDKTERTPDSTMKIGAGEERPQKSVAERINELYRSVSVSNQKKQSDHVWTETEEISHLLSGVKAARNLGFPPEATKSSWTVDEVTAWLREVGVPDEHPFLRGINQSNIDGAKLLTLSLEEIQKMCGAAARDAQSILVAIQDLREVQPFENLSLNAPTGQSCFCGRLKKMGGNQNMAYAPFIGSQPPHQCTRYQPLLRLL
ncbi:hypothetical protein Ciccas_013156 [Cichlidogyrus casuarinus]|uniref:SAM domain-containing protein n=1 Tax=Cichlidogyrus casuarinus TaxID=1844966 RepID=A0ABD2PLV9_9PLAT